MTTAQLILSASVPSILIILSWRHNNTRLSRLGAGQDSLGRRIDESNHRMDDRVRSFHADMMSFQASLLEATY